MSTKKSDSVTVRLPEELRRFEAYGFKNMSEFIKSAITDYIKKNDAEVGEANDIMSAISAMIEKMEADRDYNYPEDGYPKEKSELLAALYGAGKHLANAKMMVDHPANWIDYPEEMKEDGYDHPDKHYIHTWAR